MNAAVAQERWQGQIIDDKYALLEWLGGSANTAVFRTQVPGLPQPAAIKLVRAEGANPVQQIARWKEAATLSHPNLLRIFDAGQCQITGAYWIYCVMEYAEENLDQVLPIRPLSATEVAELLSPLVDALSFVHARGLVHSRIQPSNVFAMNNQLKLSSDSLRAASQPAARSSQLTAYDAPEFESGKLNAATDIWSLGMTLATAFNQRPLSWSRSGQLGPAIPKSIPAPYRLIVAECLRISPGERCSLERIKELVSQEPVRAVVASAPVPKRKLVGPMLAVVALAIVGLALLVRHSTQKQLSQIPEQEQAAGTSSVAPQSVIDSRPASDISSKPVERHTARHQAIPPSISPQAQDVSTRAVTTSGSPTGGVVDRVLPTVPLSARRTIHGKVHVKVHVIVNPGGEVSAASLSSPGPSRYFARLALEASQKWKFAPSSNQSQWMLEWKFGRSETEVTSTEVR